MWCAPLLSTLANKKGLPELAMVMIETLPAIFELLDEVRPARHACQRARRFVYTACGKLPVPGVFVTEMIAED